jgi:hypothetical protein
LASITASSVKLSVDENEPQIAIRSTGTPFIRQKSTFYSNPEQSDTSGFSANRTITRFPINPGANNPSVENTDSSVVSPNNIPGRSESSPSTTQDAQSNAVALTPATDNAASVLPPGVSVPLAFTTSPEGATPGQAATLDRLQRVFASRVNGANKQPNSPAYTSVWQSAQELSDSNYAQQFGTQAFINAQLAQVHGGAK